ncbi:hypothetical protein AOLI_G00240770 [Acnodon oligacanthus]
MRPSEIFSAQERFYQSNKGPTAPGASLCRTPSCADTSVYISSTKSRHGIVCGIDPTPSPHRWILPIRIRKVSLPAVPFLPFPLHRQTQVIVSCGSLEPNQKVTVVESGQDGWDWTLASEHRKSLSHMPCM